MIADNLRSLDEVTLSEVTDKRLDLHVDEPPEGRVYLEEERSRKVMEQIRKTKAN
jgi:hypothetical protein